MNATASPSVDRRQGLTYDQLETEYQQHLRPVVIPDFCKDWPAFSQWTLPGLRARYPDLEVPISGKKVKLGAFIDEVLSASPEKPCGYLRDFQMIEFMPEVLPEVAPIPGYDRNRLHHPLLPLREQTRMMLGPPQLLISGPGTHFPVLHWDFDYIHAYITQIQGEKEFTVFRPDETPNLYARTDNPNLSEIDRFDPVDLERFPKFAKAQPIRFTAYPGDTVFVPSGWWHYTRTLSPSLAVTWNSVTKVNWHNFSRAFYLDHDRQRGVKGALKRVYLDALGVAMSMGGR